MAEPDVFVAIPVWQGAELLPEMLRSLRAQTHGDFRALLSVDGDDAASSAVCRAIVGDDSRFELVEQPTHLGWPGNFNWLVEHCDRPFFCYWQQDDLASTGYLEAMRAGLLATPGAAVAFTDVQWFGTAYGRDEARSISGTAIERVLEQMEWWSPIPLRGMTRTSCLPVGAPAIAPTQTSPSGSAIASSTSVRDAAVRLSFHAKISL